MYRKDRTVRCLFSDRRYRIDVRAASCRAVLIPMTHYRLINDNPCVCMDHEYVLPMTSFEERFATYRNMTAIPLATSKMCICFVINFVSSSPLLRITFVLHNLWPKTKTCDGHWFSDDAWVHHFITSLLRLAHAHISCSTDAPVASLIDSVNVKRQCAKETNTHLVHCQHQPNRFYCTVIIAVPSNVWQLIFSASVERCIVDVLRF